MAGLNQQDLDILGYYVKNNNRELYWNYLAKHDGNDGYPLLALGVVRNDNLPGATANVFAQNHAGSVNHFSLSERQWETFGQDLIGRDFAGRKAHFENHRPDLALNLPVEDVQAAHDAAFQNVQIDTNAWTPRELLEAARRHGGEPAAEQIWKTMLDNQTFGLNRAGKTVVDIYRYDDAQWSPTGYLARLSAANVAARSEQSNTDPNHIARGPVDYSYDRGEHRWYAMYSEPGMAFGRPMPVKDTTTIPQLDDVRAVRLEREAKQHQFHSDDPFSRQPIARSPFSIAENEPAAPRTQAVAQSVPPRPNAGTDAWFNYLVVAMHSGDDRALMQAAGLVSQSPLGQQFHAQSVERVQAQDRQAALEANQQRISLLAENPAPQRSGPVMRL